jgi:transcriptional regulator with XRE-family HTH domain
MGREKTRIPPSYFREAPAWYRRTHTEWSGVVGDRVRRMRVDRGLTLGDMTKTIEKPGGGGYSESYFSRLERGGATSQLYVYLALAEYFEIHPGRLLGIDDVERDAAADEMVLIRFLRRIGIAPDAALEVLMAHPPDPEPERAPERGQRKPIPPLYLERGPTPPRQEMFKPRYELMRRDFDVPLRDVPDSDEP